MTTSLKDRAPPRPAKLTRNQDLVLACLTHATTPLSAYALLDRLREEGLKAPAQIYRALEKLTALGLVHRLESLNAFAACEDLNHHRGCGTSQDSALVVLFMICRRCGLAREVSDPSLSAALAALCAAEQFQGEQHAIEIQGVCRNCAETAESGGA